MQKDGTAKNVVKINPTDYMEMFYYHKEKNIISLCICVWAEDSKHAVKIANEKRIQLIALNRWGDMNKYGTLIKWE